MPVGLHLGTGLGPPNIPSAGSLKSAAQRLVQRPTSSIRLERAGSIFSERDVELYGSEGVLGPSSRRGPPMAINGVPALRRRVPINRRWHHRPEKEDIAASDGSGLAEVSTKS